MGLLAALAFARDEEAFLALRNEDRHWTASQTGKGELIYKFLVRMNELETLPTRSLATLARASRIGIAFSPIVKGSQVLGGRVLCTFNGATQVTLPIPPQTVNGFISAPIPAGTFSRESLHEP